MSYFPLILPGLGIFVLVYLLGEKFYSSIRQILLGNQVLTDKSEKRLWYRKMVTLKDE